MKVSRIPNILTALVFLASLMTSFALWNYAQRSAENELQAEFDFYAHEMIDLINQRMAAYVQVLFGVRALFTETESVTRDQFSTYITSLRLEEQYPGIQGLSHSPLITHAEKSAHIAEMRKQGFASYSIKPAGEREHYAPVVYIEPFSDRNIKVLGYDTYFEGDRHAAMVQARDTDRASVTSKLTLVQETGEQVQSGFLVFLPVYRKDMSHATVEQRRHSIYGWVTAVFRMGDLMSHLVTKRSNQLNLAIYDGVHVSDQTRMYASGDQTEITTPYKPRLSSIQHVQISDRMWTIIIQSTPQFEARFSNNTPIVVAITGAVFTLLLTMLAHALVRSNRMASELAESEERWRWALEGAGDGVWDWNIENSMVKFSQRWKQMLGYTEREIENKFSEWEKRVHPDDLQKALEAIQAHLKGETSAYINEHRLLHKDGSWRWILDRGMVTNRDNDGRPVRMIGTHADITEWKQSADKIQRLSRLYSTLGHCDQAIVHSATEDELFPRICQDAVKYGGYKMAWIGLVDETRLIINTVACYGEGTEYLDNIVISVDPGNPSACDPACAAIREECPIWYKHSEKYPITTAWQNFSNKYGWKAWASIPLYRNGRVIGTFNLYASDPNAFDDQARELLVQMATDTSFALDNFSEARRRRKAEEELIDLNATLESRVKERTDELVNAKELADAASQAKTDFLSNMSHEIRTPLTAIVGFAEALIANDFNKEEHKNMTMAIVRNGKHLQQIIDDILDLSKIEAGQLELEQIDTSLFDVLGEIDSMLGTCARDKGLDFRINYQFPLPNQIQTDPTTLKQILINLVSNAIKFTVEGLVQVDVSCDETYRNIQFEVSDSGIGMSRNEVEHVFDPFTQADSTTTRRFGGTGLGLSISSKLALANGGKLTCVSEKGVGSSFSLSITNKDIGKVSIVNSMKEIGSKNVVQQDPVIRSLAGRILLVEDNADNQQLISMYVSRTGALLDIAENGQDGLDKALKDNYDLVLMDMQMPVLDGLEAIKLLRKRGYDKPIISLTANAMLSNREKCLAAGANGYLVKPINLVKFYEALNTYLPEVQEIAELESDITDDVHQKSMDFYNSSSYLDIVERFKQKLPQIVAELTEAVQTQNWDIVQSKSHDLKGLGGTLGLHEITDVAGRMNIQVKEKDYEQVVVTSTELEHKSQNILG
ncbi:MAG: PAS domain-containing protein [Gammaproteobacteria bacterium]|nr:PAS domain-containing protein [Gammaproteobacteria bacterium]